MWSGATPWLNPRATRRSATSSSGPSCACKSSARYVWFLIPAKRQAPALGLVPGVGPVSPAWRVPEYPWQSSSSATSRRPPALVVHAGGLGVLVHRLWRLVRPDIRRGGLRGRRAGLVEQENRLNLQPSTVGGSNVSPAFGRFESEQAQRRRCDAGPAKERPVRKRPDGPGRAAGLSVSRPSERACDARTCSPAWP
jgi:hypothetical protein